MGDSDPRVPAEDDPLQRESEITVTWRTAEGAIFCTIVVLPSSRITRADQTSYSCRVLRFRRCSIRYDDHRLGSSREYSGIEELPEDLLAEYRALEGGTIEVPEPVLRHHLVLYIARRSRGMST